MKLRYNNPDAIGADIQMPSIQDAPLEYGKTYEVEDDLATLLLESAYWAAVVDAQEQTKKRGRAAKKESTVETTEE